MRLFLAALVFALLLPLPAAAGSRDKQLAEAAEIFGELKGKIPDSTRKEATCVSVLTIAKAGFLLGGIGGRGFLMCKVKGKGTWSAPVVQDIGGGTAGAQIGGAKIQLVMVFTEVDDLDEVATATPVFGGSATATAGSKGTGVGGGGNPEAESGVYTVSRSEGLYAGAVGEGLVVKPDEEETEELHGRKVTLEQVLLEGAVPVPKAAKALHDAVSRWSAGK